MAVVARPESPPRRRGPVRRLARGLWRPTPDGLRRSAVATLAGLWVVVASGAFVRLSGSGFGCEQNWPRCGGSLGQGQATAWIEFANRFVAGGGSLLVAATLLVAWRLPRAQRPSGARALALGMAVLILAEVALGALTVRFHLAPEIVGAHFLLSMLIVALATVLAVRLVLDARADGVPAPPVHPALPRLAGLAAALAVPVLVAGVVTTAAGPHSGSDGVVAPRIGDLAEAVRLHAAVVYALTISTVLLAVAAWRTRAPRPVRLASLAILALIAAQIALGVTQYHLELPRAMVLAHVALAQTIWITLVATVVLTRRAASAPRGG